MIQHFPAVQYQFFFIMQLSSKPNTLNAARVEQHKSCSALTMHCHTCPEICYWCFLLCNNIKRADLITLESVARYTHMLFSQGSSWNHRESIVCEMSGRSQKQNPLVLLCILNYVVDSRVLGIFCNHIEVPPLSRQISKYNTQPSILLTLNAAMKILIYVSNDSDDISKSTKSSSMRKIVSFKWHGFLTSLGITAPLHARKRIDC